MKGEYVLSSTEFKTKKAALARIQDWDDKGDLQEPMPCIYKVIKRFRPEKKIVLKED